MLNKILPLAPNVYKCLHSVNKQHMMGSDYMKTNFEMQSEYLMYYHYAIINV